jgi:histidyl-tRNA synthetase
VQDVVFKNQTPGVAIPEDGVARLIAKLRTVGFKANFSYKGGSLKKQLKEASLANAKKCIIIGAEYDNGEIVVKDMVTGKQETILEEKFLDELEGRKG